MPPGVSELPALPVDAASRRQASDTSTHTFTEADEYASVDATWDAATLMLAEPELSFVILGFSLMDNIPLSIELGGTLSGLWLGISDYDTGSWRWLDGPYDASATVVIPTGTFTNTAGSIYFALVCPAGSQAELTASFGYNQLDTTPPVWDAAGTGIKSVDTGHFYAELEWYTATDAGSPPVSYLIYYAPQVDGIDWETPQITIPEGTTSTKFGGLDNGVEFEFAVRARDAVGNVTTNANSLVGTPSGDGELMIVDWEAGDKFEFAWEQPNSEDKDNMLLVIAPGYIEGWAAEPDDLAGIIEFSADANDSGLPLEWAKLEVGAPLGGYLIELHFDHLWVPGPEKYTMKLLDSENQLKQDLGFHIRSHSLVSMDFAILRHGADSWPQEANWEPGDRIEVAWGDAQADVVMWLNIGYKDGSPAYPDDLAGIIEFSEDSNVSGQPVEWGRLLPTGDTGTYSLDLEWYSYDGEPPVSLDVTVKLYDSEDQLKQDLCMVTMPWESWCDPVARLIYE